MRKTIIGFTAYRLLLALCCSPRRSRSEKIPRIGYLGANTPPSVAARIEAFRQGLRELGYVEGKNIVIEIDMQKENSIASQRSRPNWCVSR